MAAAFEMGWARSVLGEDRALVERAATMGEAAMWLLAVAVAHGACEGGLVHCVVPGEPRLATRAAHGPNATDALGAHVSMHDAAFYGAVRDGAIAHQKDWARSMTTLRLLAAGLSAIGVLAMPLRARGAMIGFVEVSAPQRRMAFTPTNAAVLRELADAFDARPVRI